LSKGVKHDQNKTRWSLLPWREVEEIVRVLMHGSREYNDYNWQKVENGRERYFNAAKRHLLAWWQGERPDPESKLPHLAHAACCILFLMWLDNEEDRKEYTKLFTDDEDTFEDDKDQRHN